MKNNLRKLAFERDVTISTISRKTGISRTTLTALFKNTGDGITFATLEKLCAFFDCTVGDFLILTDKENRSIKEAANQ